MRVHSSKEHEVLRGWGAFSSQASVDAHIGPALLERAVRKSHGLGECKMTGWRQTSTP